jgi:hypothetical protein
MKKVVDHGALWSEGFKDFLASSKNNFAVLTDYSGMESFAGNIERSFSVLRHYPEQVIVLKGSGKIARLRPRKRGAQGRLIDEEQTRQFHKFCRALPDHPTANDFPTLVERAQSRKEHLAQYSQPMREAITQRVGKYPANELKLLRSSRKTSTEFGDIVMKDILSLTSILLAKKEHDIGSISLDDAIFSFPFRYCVCAMFLVLHWAEKSGLDSLPDKAIRNAFTDMTYAAYATFFDGIITRDKILFTLFLRSRGFLTKTIGI